MPVQPGEQPRLRQLAHPPRQHPVRHAQYREHPLEAALAAGVVAVLLNIFFNVLLPGTAQGPSEASAPALLVSEDEADVLSQGGAFRSGRPDTAGVEILEEKRVTKE